MREELTGDARCQPTAEPVRQHSPLPWSYRPDPYDDWGWIKGHDGKIAAVARAGCEYDADEHRAAKTDPYGPNAAFIVEAVNSHASLKARAEQAEQEVDVLESNAREQAKLLADTGRRVEELKRECRILREVMNAPSEPDVIRLHREKCNALDRVFALEGVLREIERVGQWSGTDGLTYKSAEGRIATAALAPSTPAVSR